MIESFASKILAAIAYVPSDRAAMCVSDVLEALANKAPFLEEVGLCNKAFVLRVIEDVVKSYADPIGAYSAISWNILSVVEKEYPVKMPLESVSSTSNEEFVSFMKRVLIDAWKDGMAQRSRSDALELAVIEGAWSIARKEP